jgi:response regulator RpfG family c-di-GMP phosphodiesterase
MARSTGEYAPPVWSRRKGSARSKIEAPRFRKWIRHHLSRRCSSHDVPPGGPPLPRSESRALKAEDAFNVRFASSSKSNFRMPEMGGLELQRRLNEARSRVPIVFVTAHDDRARRLKAMEAGAANFFRKPFGADAFIAAVQAALRSGRNCDRTSFSKPEETDALLSVRSESSQDRLATRNCRWTERER